MIQVLALVAHPEKSRSERLAREIAARYPTLEVLVEERLGSGHGLQAVGDDELGARADAVLALGGDGTLIYAARLLKDRSVPLLGINLGSLGFMTETPISDAFAAIDSLLAGTALIDSRMKLHCRLVRDETVLFEREVLNDVVINKGVLARMAAHEVWLNDAFVATYQADGMIFSTPSGSTAYSMSAGGPIVHPAVDCVIVTPICPHALTQRPVVVPSDQLIRIRLVREAADVFLSVDGQSSFALVGGDQVEVRKASHRVQLVRNPRMDYFSVLRQKLRWGERGSEKDSSATS